MLLDYVTLLTAVGISAACLSVMIFVGWLMAPKDSFLLTCAFGGGLSGIGILIYGGYVIKPVPLIAVAAYVVMLTGMAMLAGSGYGFRTDRSPRRLIITTSLIACVFALPALALGYTGLGFIPVNLAMAALLFLTSGQYWGARHQAPTAVTSLCVLYSAVGVSFVLCAVMLGIDGRPVIEGAPQGWAEDLSLLIMIACVPGIGAITLALNQSRLARVHHRQAMTDPLSGLMNRRALFEAVGSRPLLGSTAIIVFDIDRFKAINDQHGHNAGDRVIALFATTLERHAAAGSMAARLGGEEFALVVPSTTADGAVRLTEAIRESFADASGTELNIEGLTCSVSAGIAFGVTHGEGFEQVLNEADHALYAAKNAGRDRFAVAEPRLASSGPIRMPSSRPSRP